MVYDRAGFHEYAGMIGWTGWPGGGINGYSRQIDGSMATETVATFGPADHPRGFLNMGALVRHANVQYQDQPVPLTGHMYDKCQFTRCTLVVKGIPFSLNSCTMTNCAVEVDWCVHDTEQLAMLRRLLDMLAPSLPQVQTGKAPAVTAPAKSGSLATPPRSEADEPAAPSKNASSKRK